MTETLVKWANPQPRAWRRIEQRLRFVMKRQPTGIPRLVRYGWTENRLRIEMQRIRGCSFEDHIRRLNLSERKGVTKIFGLQAERWRAEGFVHGDLSPRNILVGAYPANENAPFYFIDWILDLQSAQGTPLYCAPRVFSGLRDFSTDRFAFQKISQAYGLA